MPTFTSNQFTTADAVTFFQGLHPDLAEVDFFPGPYIEDIPHQIVTVTLVSGAGFSHEGVTDDKVFQVRARGLDHDPGSAEALALYIDEAVLKADVPTDVGTKRVVACYRFGNPPSPLSATPDNAHRWEYIANYLFRVATDI